MRIIRFRLHLLISTLIFISCEPQGCENDVDWTCVFSALILQEPCENDDLRYSEIRPLPDSLATNRDESSDENRFSIVPKVYGGLKVSDFRGSLEPWEDHKSILGPGIGLQWNVPLHDQISFLPALQYSVGGNKAITHVDDTYMNYTYTTIVRMRTIDIQPYVNFDLTRSLSIHGGPRASHLLSAKRINESSHGTRSEVNSSEGLKSWDIGLGAGLEYQIPGTFLGLSGTFNHGLSNIIDDPAGYMPARYTQSLQISLRFDLGQGLQNSRRYMTK